jgi:hypothetical protein
VLATYKHRPPMDPNTELRRYVIFLDWSPLDHIDAITISPYADGAYEQRARAAIESWVVRLFVTICRFIRVIRAKRRFLTGCR